jgi:oligopeptide transport system substrate-binding protein
MHKKPFRLAVLALAVCLLLAACGQSNNAGGQTVEPDPTPAEPINITVSAGEGQDTLDPAFVTASGGETILYHLYENLLRWEDDGDGYAKLALGQAESYEVETDYAGNATYTFTLRWGIFWSDGQSVTANDFVTAWQRLADPAVNSPHRELMSVISGYDQVQQTGDPTLLAVSAPDDQTLVVTLNGSCAYFLSEICAGAYTMPVRSDLVAAEDWGQSAPTVTNGAYTASQFRKNLTVLERNEDFYDEGETGPATIRFIPATDSETDYASFLSGDVDLVTDLPSETIETLGETWLPEAATETYAVLFNAGAAPFDNEAVRQAFSMSIDPQQVLDALGDPTLRLAAGLVPYGVADYGQRDEDEDEEDETLTLPDPNAQVDEAEEEAPTYWDFRAHSQELVTLPTSETDDYADACHQARLTLTQAGFGGGEGLPELTYIYVDTPENAVVAQTLQTMWKNGLGIEVAIEGLSQEDYDARLSAATDSETEGTANFYLAGASLKADYNDAEAILSLWRGGGVTGYESDAFDILLTSADAAVSTDARDAYLHDAEAILLTDHAVVPLYYEGTSYLLSDQLTGLYRAPDGVFFLTGLTWAVA